VSGAVALIKLAAIVGVIALVVRWRLYWYAAILVLTLIAWRPVEDVVSSDVTIYRAMCTPIEYEFWECGQKGGALSELTSMRYHVDYEKQMVVRLGDGFTSTYRFDKCSVADRLNWSCHYNDDSGIVELSGGQSREIPLAADSTSLMNNLKSEKATGQIGYLRSWMLTVKDVWG